MKNYSRQREAILKVLKSTKSHPNANEIYMKVREEIPNISLGTVYRNLAELSVNGDILKLSVDGFERFDGDISPHIHLQCRSCGKITDVPIEKGIFKTEEEQFGFSSESYALVVSGLCKDCKK